MFLVRILYSGLIITRDEGGLITKELYHQNRFAEIHDDKIVSIWDFNKNELTLVNHQLKIYTTTGFDGFRTEMKKQNKATIESQFREMGEERVKMLASATRGTFRQMRPGFILVDTTKVHGYKTYQYHVYNGSIIVQKIWISKELQTKIDKEVNPVNIKNIESVFKENRSEYFDAMGIELDPVSSVVEAIEDVGYVVQRVDYGLRSKSDPVAEAEMDKSAGTIDEVLVMSIDSDIFQFHTRYKKVGFSEYQHLLNK